MVRKIRHGEKVLLVAMAARRERARQCDGPPEESGRIVILRIARDLVDTLEADDLGNLRIGVQSVQVIAALGERLQYRLVREELRQLAVVRIAAHLVEIGEDFIHAAMLGVQHDFELRIGQRSCRGDRPIGKAHQYRTGCFAVRQQRRVAQARENFVQRVPGHASDLLTAQMRLHQCSSFGECTYEAAT